MAKGKYLSAALLAAVSVPALGSVIVIGNSSARLCYEAAESPANPTLRDLRDCDAAFSGEALSQHDRVATHVNRGILRLRRGQVDEAIADFDAAIALDPRQPEAYLNKGAALIRIDNPSEALGLFTVALEHNTRRPEIAHFGRAIANEELGNIREAYYDYRRASELDPNWQDPRTELARFRVIND
ncbi:MAG: tetratricopeptide repeat protein [Pseudomonadota bacterium]|nr:tetratricopeptide repeat protein [Pseudomonadota bacterium]